MTEIHIERRSEPDRLRYLAAKLREGGNDAAVALALEVAAEEMGDVAGYTVLEQRPGAPPTTAIYFWPESLYPDATRAEREARRAQAHGELDADLNEHIPAYSIAEVRRVKGTP